MDNNTQTTDLDAYMQGQPSVQEEVKETAAQQALQQQMIEKQQPNNQNPIQQETPSTDQVNVYETLYNWGVENEIFDIDVNELLNYEPDIDIKSEAGFKRLMQIQSELYAEDILQKRFKGWSDKQINDFIDAVNNGASISDFAQVYSEGDWETINLGNIVNQKLVVRKDLELQGKSKGYIDDYIDMLEQTGKLANFATEHQNSLIHQQDSQRQAYLENLKNESELADRQLELYEQTFLNKLNYIDNVAGLPIDYAEKNELYEFVFEPKPLYYEDGTPYVNEQGNQEYGTDYQVMINQLDEEQQIDLQMLIARYLLNGQELGGIKNIYNQQVNSLEQKLKNVNLANQNKLPSQTNADALSQHIYSNNK
ncbi:MAG TPA: hypothetical protein PKD00_01900 [Burkholderiales bacterium]|nr:hypothetical protein [Burkholderiales bacterium]